MLKRLVLAFVLVLPLATSACGSRDGVELTPRQKAYDLATKYEGFQILAEKAVTNPATPEVVKNAIKAATSTATAAVIDYTEAAKRGDVNLAGFLSIAIDGMVNVVTALTQYGFITVAPPSLPPEETSQSDFKQLRQLTMLWMIQTRPWSPV